MTLSVFVSHSSRDEDLALGMVHLIERSLGVGPSEIRCTSVTGYRLAAGVDVDAVLRDEVNGAKAFVALLTPSSLESQYVLFELGARWGARLSMFPVLARGATLQRFSSPLVRFNPLDGSDPGQVHQLIQDLGSALEHSVCGAHIFQREIEAVVQLACASANGGEAGDRGAGLVSSTRPRGIDHPGLRQQVVQLLTELAQNYGDVYVEPGIPGWIQKAARDRNWLQHGDDPIGFVDNSYGGKDGLAILASGIVWRNSHRDRPGRMQWAELAALPVRADNEEDSVRIGVEVNIDFSGSNVPAEEVARLLRRIADRIRATST